MIEANLIQVLYLQDGLKIKIKMKNNVNKMKAKEDFQNIMNGLKQINDDKDKNKGSNEIKFNQEFN